MNTERYRDRLLHIVTDLIENKGVTRFYSGFRGDFDVFCSNLVYGLKDLYPQIRITMVLSYIPQAPKDGEYAFKLPKCFDDSIYLLERKVPKRFAITETNKLIVDTVDVVVAGVLVHGGGAYAACEYARKRNKPVVSVVDGCDNTLN